MSSFWGSKDYSQADKIAQEEFIDKYQADFPKQETSPEHLELLSSNGWFRIGENLWRHIETTNELSTNDALIICNLRKELEEDKEETQDLAAESRLEEVATVEEYIEQFADKSKSKAQFQFPDEIYQQLNQQFAMITGRAGSGKSTLIQQLSQLDSKYIEKGATTGIAAVNCGGRTIHSLLRYFNTESLKKAYNFGRLHARLRMIRFRKRILGIEEVSMLDARQLDIIATAIDDINLDEDKPHDLGLHLVGDFCQLPPVNADFAFKARCWNSLFAPNIIKLEKIWRQDNIDFIEAINFMRAGKGQQAVELLKICGVRFESKLNNEFDGTTLIPTNSQVDIYNAKKLAAIDSPMIRISPIRRGSQLKEWDRNSRGEWGIPFEQRFKLNAYVMILRNDSKNFTYVNGDCGWIRGFDSVTNIFKVELVRTKSIVEIGFVKESNLQDEQPSENDFNSMFYPHLDPVTDQWVVGTISWIPLRLAYASTIHKAQGLSLDKVQIDSRPNFYAYPSMSYVAVSRARTPEGLVIVGSEYDFAMKVKTSNEVKKWI